MFLTQQIKVKPGDAAKILAQEDRRICSKMNLSVVTGVFVPQPSERDVGFDDEFCRSEL